MESVFDGRLRDEAINRASDPHSPPAELGLIGEGKAYGIEETDEGFRVIKRYALIGK